MPTYKVDFSPLHDQDDLWVSNVINPMTRSWDNVVLSSMLSSYDANIVMNIHLSTKPCEDRLI